MVKRNLKKYDVVIKGAYGAANFGDDALLHSLLNNFFINKKIAVIGKKNSYTERMFSQVDYYASDEDILLETSLLVYGGGTQFYNFDTISYFFKKIYKAVCNPNIIFNKFFPPNKTEIKYNKVIYLGVGFGPFKSIKKRNILLNNFHFENNLFVRDDLSNSYFSNKAIKIDDICLMDYKNYEVKEKDNNGKIAIIIRDWEFDSNSRHVDKVVDFYKKYNKNNMDFIFFGNDFKAKKILKNNSINYIEWNPSTQSIDEFNKILSEYKLIISSRYHGVIFGLINEIPTIAIEIEPKLSQVSLEYPNVKLWHNDFNIDVLFNMVNTTNYFNNNFKENIFSISEINDLILQYVNQ